MTKWIVAVVVVVVLIFSIGYYKSEPEKLSKTGLILTGEHQLRKMMERTDATSNISGGFFLFAGAFSGSTTTNTSVTFSWKMNDGTYAISKLPLEKIRVKFDEKTVTPTIKFRWERHSLRETGEMQPQDLMDNYVIYALITAKESDWPVEVNLPMNK